jgi:catechol 2,3-dioxygenase-like lactoylglutathione lyase family enzyme
MSLRIKSMSPQLLVSDIDRSIEFYTNTLAFELIFRYEYFYAGIGKDGCSIHLKSGTPSPLDLSLHSPAHPPPKKSFGLGREFQCSKNLPNTFGIFTNKTTGPDHGYEPACKSSYYEGCARWRKFA